MHTLSITEARKKLPELVNKAYLNSQSFIITKGNIPMAKIIKADEKVIKKNISKKNILEAIKAAKKIKGIWNDKEWKNKSSVEIVDYLRERSQKTYVR